MSKNMALNHLDITKNKILEKKIIGIWQKLFHLIIWYPKIEMPEGGVEDRSL